MAAYKDPESLEEENVPFCVWTFRPHASSAPGSAGQRSIRSGSRALWFRYSRLEFRAREQPFESVYRIL